MGRQKRAYQSVTIRDVAERAGVAVSTVSRVLNGLDRVSEETRRRVEQAARELSYVPNNFAASMVTGQSKILGIIVPSFTHDFFGFIAQTAEHVFRKHGYLTIVSASGEDPVADPAAFLQRFYHMLDGVLLVPTAARLKDLESFDKPLLLVDRDMPGSSFSSISFDNEPACYELTRRLTEKGHRRIAALTADPDDSSISQLRYSGYARALRELGIPFCYIGEYLEESPLGKAEWLVAVAETIDRREEGERAFAPIPERYEALKAKVAESAARPKVMINAPYGDSWFMASAESYVARLIADAGGDYIYRENTSNRSLPIDLEKAYLLASGADVWINAGSFRTLAEFRARLPKFAGVPCVRRGEIYNCDRRTNAAGGNDYWESGVVRPDVVLHDLIAVFHPEALDAADREMHYYRKLE